VALARKKRRYWDYDIPDHTQVRFENVPRIDPEVKAQAAKPKLNQGRHFKNPKYRYSYYPNPLSRAPKIKDDVKVYPLGKTGDGLTLESYNFEALLISESHYKLRSGAWSGGGPFFCWKQQTLHHQGIEQFPYQVGFSPGSFFIDNRYDIKGVAPGHTKKPSTLLNDAISSRDATGVYLNGMYPKAFGKSRPGNPIAGLGQFLIELKELPAFPLLTGAEGLTGAIAKFRGQRPFKGIPFHRIPQHLLEKLGQFRNLGSEYLNGVFGWKPFIADLVKVYDLTHYVEAEIAKLIRENRKAIRRRGTLIDERSTSRSQTLYPYSYANVGGSPPVSTGYTNYVVTTRERTRVWYSFMYQYYIPDTGSLLWNAKARAALFGALPTPSLVWEVLPWSWLIDWFANVGQLYANLSPNAVDNLVTRRAFVMKRVEVETTYDAFVSHPAAAGFYWYPGVNHLFRTTFKQEVLSRIHGGNPYGLALDLPAGFTPNQIAVLAALGITQGQVRNH
jgi:hypothetical protein